jgi:aryl-alcohol dehydrogenase-like predicted oxidoreductase
MKRKIGKMGLETSALGMGCWAIGGEWDFVGFPAGWGKTDDAESIRAIHAAYDNGIRLFDTAATYGAGHSEVLLGQALGKRRDDCIIVSKFGYDVDVNNKSVINYGESQVTADVISHVKTDCEASLQRLKMESIDIFLLHIGDFDSQLAGELIIALE